MSTTTVTFPGHDGTELSAIIDLPANPRAFALFAHCFTCSKKSPAAARIARALGEQGIGVMRFDFQGLGDSAGDFADNTFTADRKNLVAAAAWLEQNYAAPQLLIGHSLGGAAALAAASDIPSLKAVTSIAAPYDPEHVTGLFDGALEEIDSTGHATVTIGGKQVTIGQQMVADLKDANQKARIEAIDIPALVMHSPTDELVEVHNSQAIYRALHTSKSFIMLDGADHLLTKKGQAARAAGIIAAWATPYLELTELPSDAAVDAVDRQAQEVCAQACTSTRSDDAYTEHGEVVVFPNGEGDFGTTVQAGHHQWRADEPTSVPGAKDAGPNPYDMLLGGLGVCTSMTMDMYARRKKFSLGDTRVRVTYDSTKEDGEQYSTFTRIIEFDQNLSAEQRDKLLMIADKCPVHRTLHSHIEVETKAAD